MRKRYKVFLYIIIALVVLLSATTVYMKFFRGENNKNTNKSNVVHNIDKFGYSLDDRDSALMKEEFYSLEKLLKAEEIDYEEYAKSVSKLFIIDLYSIDNKINKYDIGGLEYIIESEQEKFKNIILDSIYAIVLDDSNHKREQELPMVKDITINEIKEDTYKFNDSDVSSYIVSLSWSYENDFGYDSNALITLIKEDDKLFIVEYTPVDSNEEVIDK